MKPQQSPMMRNLNYRQHQEQKRREAARKRKKALDSLNKIGKNSRVLVQIENKAYLGTVTSIRLGQYFIVLDNNDKVTVKARSKFFLGKGIDTINPNPISLDDVPNYKIDKVIRLTDRKYTRKAEMTLADFKNLVTSSTIEGYERYIKYESDSPKQEMLYTIAAFLRKNDIINAKQLNSLANRRHRYNSPFPAQLDFGPYVPFEDEDKLFKVLEILMKKLGKFLNLKFKMSVSKQQITLENKSVYISVWIADEARGNDSQAVIDIYGLK